MTKIVVAADYVPGATADRTCSADNGKVAKPSLELGAGRAAVDSGWHPQRNSWPRRARNGRD